MGPSLQPRVRISIAPGQYLAILKLRVQLLVTLLGFPLALNARPRLKRKNVIVRVTTGGLGGAQHLPRLFFISMLVFLLSLIINMNIPYG